MAASNESFSSVPSSVAKTRRVASGRVASGRAARFKNDDDDDDDDDDDATRKNHPKNSTTVFSFNPKLLGEDSIDTGENGFLAHAANTWTTIYYCRPHNPKEPQNKRNGVVAQMVERALSMREVPGSIPGNSIGFL